jgi:hypothetical protein
MRILSCKLGNEKSGLQVGSRISSQWIFLIWNFCFFSDRTWFTLSWNVSSQNNRYWCSENLHAVHEVPLHDIKASVWCAGNTCKIIGTMSLEETNSDHCI